MDEFEVRDILREERKSIKTHDDLCKYIKKVETNYNFGYGVAVRAVAQAVVATANYLLCEMGCTGFQASCVLWDVIKDLLYRDNQCGMKLVNYDDMLYPQYHEKFNKTISQATWDELQKIAAKNIQDSPNVHPNVIAHWQSIIDGNIPFGYSIDED